MKKITAQIIALIAINASAYDVTNTVTIVSNIYNRISEEHWITNNIKNTHTNYHYTNNVYTVSNVTLLVSQQTFKTNTTVNLDVSQQAIADARAQANRASQFAADALGYASSAAEQAGNAQEHSLSAQNFRDEAEYYANQAHAQVQPIIDEGARQIAAVKDAADIQVGRVNSVGNSNVGSVNSAGRTVLNNIDAKQAWFDQHFGQIVTNIDINVSTNFYIAEDMLARAGVAQNAADIASLEGRVGDNIQQLTTRMGTAEGNISSLGSRMGTAEGGIASLNGSVSKLVARVGTNEVKIADLNKFAGESSNRLDQVESDIESLEFRVGDNIQQLTTRIGTAELNITTLGTRMGTAEGNITTLGTRISMAEGEISALKPMLGVATNYVISTDDSAVPEAVFELGYKNNPQNVVIGYVKIRRGFNESSDHINYTTGYSYAVAQPNVNLFSSYDNSWWFSPNYEQYRYFRIVLMDQGGYYIDAQWNGYTYNGDPYNFPMTEAGNVIGNWRGTSGRTLYCKMISNTINMRTDLKYIQGTFVYDKDGNKVDELIFKSEVSNYTQRLDAHIRTADANFNDIFARLRVLEASISHKNYIYDFKRSGTQLGTLTVNTDNPTVTADTSEYTEYSYPYTTTWSQSSTTASPSVTSCKKRIYKNGITNPQTMVTFSMSSGVQITMNSTTTYNSIKSYFTDSVQFTTYNPQYTFILSFNKTSD